MIGSTSGRRLVRVTLVRGLRHRSLGPIRRTFNCHSLVSTFNLARRRITAHVNGSHATIAGTLHLLGLGSGRLRTLHGNLVATNRTEALVAIRSGRLHRGVLATTRGNTSIHRLREVSRLTGGSRGAIGGARGGGLCDRIRLSLGDRLRQGIGVAPANGNGNALAIRFCDSRRLRTFTGTLYRG